MILIVGHEWKSLANRIKVDQMHASFVTLTNALYYIYYTLYLLGCSMISSSFRCNKYNDISRRPKLPGLWSYKSLPRWWRFQGRLHKCHMQPSSTRAVCKNSTPSRILWELHLATLWSPGVWLPVWRWGVVHEIWFGPYNDVLMSAIASQITIITIVYSAVYSGAEQRKHQSSASLAFVWWIHLWPVNSPHKGSVTRKMFPFDDVIMARWPLKLR